jgi:hypothetical protein
MIGNIVAGMIGSPPKPIPLTIPTLELWLDASDTSTLTLSGSAVTQWNDKSGKGYTFTQGTSAYRPQSGTRTQNGLNVLDYDTNDYLESTAALSTWKFLHDGTDYTIFLAFKHDVSNVFEMIISTYEGSTGNSGIGVFKNNTNKFSHYVARSVGGTSAVFNTDTASTNTNFNYWAILADPDNATAANRSDMRLKKGSAIKNNTDTNAVSAANPRPFRLGAYDNINNDGLDGMFGEIIIYKSILSSGDLLTVQDYLAAKWGV